MASDLYFWSGIQGIQINLDWRKVKHKLKRKNEIRDNRSLQIIEASDFTRKELEGYRELQKTRNLFRRKSNKQARQQS